MISLYEFPVAGTGAGINAEAEEVYIRYWSLYATQYTKCRSTKLLLERIVSTAAT